MLMYVYSLFFWQSLRAVGQPCSVVYERRVRAFHCRCSARLLGSVTARTLLQSFNACFNDTQTFHILGLSNDGMQLRLIRLGKGGLVRGITSID
ncbi:hypothetical protein EDB92DRAFT_1846211 [Lactarius akahatsu]|uniref:Secreted protein n=1 Tax=Lactarius akahatsu TaxID=416441 RepID=A0AAD4LQB6_9AGAM|nr:hypothetical protein EDB92DRAFT_1846211 [Lactarius akahatsu]